MLLAAPGVASAEKYVAGDPGGGDPFFPEAGNGGYDVAHYSLDLKYVRASNQLTGKVAVFARATENLSSFNLDLRDFYDVSKVTVNLQRASFSHRRPGARDHAAARAQARQRRSWSVSTTRGSRSRSSTRTTRSRAGCRPRTAPSWSASRRARRAGIPVNDSLRDKATFDFAITVPKGSTAIANGVLLSRRDRGDSTTWRWLAPAPMAPYLATATNGIFQTRFERLTGGLRRFDAVDPQTRVRRRRPAEPRARLPAPRPRARDRRLLLRRSTASTRSRASAGSSTGRPIVGYALESQTRVNYDRIPAESTVVHEIAHQWFGDAVGLTVWPDMWLNEGFATWSEWIYDERHGGPTAQERFDEDYATPEDSDDGQDLWFPAPNALPGRLGAVLHPGLRARGDDAPGAAPEGRRPRRSSRSCARGTARTATAT